MKNARFQRNFVVFLLITVLLASCQKSDRSEFESPVHLDKNLVESLPMFEKIVKARSIPQNLVFSIDELIREDGILKVLLKGGSVPADFLVVWNGLIMESHPMQTSLVVVYRGKPERFDPEKEVEIHIDLNKMLPAGSDLSDFYFHLLNGSADRKISLHPDGVTTSN